MWVIQLEKGGLKLVRDFSWGEQWHHTSSGAIQVSLNSPARIVMDDKIALDFLPAGQAKSGHSLFLLQYGVK